MFSVRNVTDGNDSPVVVQVLNFSAPAGDVQVTRREIRSPSETDLWVDVLDVPVGQPMNLSVQVGSSQRGAYRLEALVLPFDKDYHVIHDSTGAEASLFAFTFLGVNKETGGTTGTGLPFTSGSVGKSLPGMEAGMAAAALGGASLLAWHGRRRRGD
jgi:hypothetical protein